MASIRKIITKAFSSGKYFLDQNYQNLTLESGNRVGNLEGLCNIFTNDGINMIFIKSHFSNAWTQNKKYCLDISIEKQTEEKIAELKQKFSDIGVTFDL
jgi:prephenate dehydratase